MNLRSSCSWTFFLLTSFTIWTRHFLYYRTSHTDQYFYIRGVKDKTFPPWFSNHAFCALQQFYCSSFLFVFLSGFFSTGFFLRKFNQMPVSDVIVKMARWLTSLVEIQIWYCMVLTTTVSQKLKLKKRKTLYFCWSFHIRVCCVCCGFGVKMPGQTISLSDWSEQTHTHRHTSAGFWKAEGSRSFRYHPLS